MSYGYTTDPEGSDPLVSLADEVMGDIFSNACAYGNWTVDILPFGELKDHFIWSSSSWQQSHHMIVRFLPDLLPGMSFKRKGREWAKRVASFNNRPYAFVQHQKVGSTLKLVWKTLMHEIFRRLEMLRIPSSQSPSKRKLPGVEESTFWSL